ncbi:endonuclease/exonuclease/phosphatase family protein [Streptomyces sp. NPDC091268]|uniref:endonuclease/exonuclease/phosphatase family protein n=1 Tax=Streptomyces sp. NPDC091268 TaxID=3365979 RepID=UPI0037FE383C
MRRLHRLVLALAVIPLAAVALLAQHHAEREDPQPPGELLRVMQWNICGAAQNCRNRGATGAGSSVARLAEQVAARHPDLLSVNEICRSQFEALQRLVSIHGWRMEGSYAQMHDNVPACGNDSSYGLAVFSKEPLTGPPQYRPFGATSEEYVAQGRAEQVRRGVLCVPTTVKYRRLLLCGAHAGTEAEQLVEAEGWFADAALFPPDLPVVFAGDLNEQPNEAPLAGIYSHTRGEKDTYEPRGRFIEADESDREWFRQGAAGGVRCDAPRATRCRNGAPTADDGRKIDYIFATEADFTSPAGRTEDFPESDHVLYEGTFRFRR